MMEPLIILLNPLFSSYLQDNCKEDVRIDIVVKSNEIQQNKINIAELFKRKRVGVVEQVDVLYAPTR